MDVVDIEHLWQQNVKERIHLLEENFQRQKDLSDVYHERIAKAREILESLNEYGWYFRIKPALEALEGK